MIKKTETACDQIYGSFISNQLSPCQELVDSLYELFDENKEDELILMIQEENQKIQWFRRVINDIFDKISFINGNCKHICQYMESNYD